MGGFRARAAGGSRHQKRVRRLWRSRLRHWNCWRVCGTAIRPANGFCLRPAGLAPIRGCKRIGNAFAASRAVGRPPHDLRHSFASFAVADGHTLFLVGKALGHRQTRTTEIYAHLSDDPLRQVADRTAARINAALTREQGAASGALVPCPASAEFAGLRAIVNHPNITPAFPSNSPPTLAKSRSANPSGDEPMTLHCDAIVLPTALSIAPSRGLAGRARVQDRRRDPRQAGLPGRRPALFDPSAASPSTALPTCWRGRRSEPADLAAPRARRWELWHERA